MSNNALKEARQRQLAWASAFENDAIKCAPGPAKEAATQRAEDIRLIDLALEECDEWLKGMRYPSSSGW